MQAKKKAGTAKKKAAKQTGAKKLAPRKPAAKKSAARRTATTKVAARKVTARKPAAKNVAARKPAAKKVKAPALRAKSTAKAPRAAEKAPARRRKTPPPELHERALPDLLADVPTAEAQLGPFETSRDPVRGGLHDRANHSKPEVALRNQNLRTLRSPERRHTMRGH